MSAIAEWIRRRVLRSQITDAQETARDLWLTINVNYGMGGAVRADLGQWFCDALKESERLTLEYRVSL